MGPRQMASPCCSISACTCAAWWPMNSMYEAVKSMPQVPVGKRALLAILLPLALPLLAMAALQVPVKELLGKVVKTLL